MINHVCHSKQFSDSFSMLLTNTVSTLIKTVEALALEHDVNEKS